MSWSTASFDDREIMDGNIWLKDNARNIVYNSAPLLTRLEETQEPDPKAGKEIEVANIHTAMSNSGFYTDGGTITTTRKTGLLKERTYPWAYAAAGMTVSQPDLLKNQGSEKRMDLLETLMKIALMDLRDKIWSQLWAASTAGNDITAFMEFFDGTSTIGSFAQSAPWAATSTASGSFAAQGITDLEELVNDVSDNGSQMPTDIITTQTYYQRYKKEARDLLHLVPTGIADVNFPHTAFSGIPLYWDSKMATNHENKLIVWNRNHTYLYPHPDDQFVMGEWVKSGTAAQWTSFLTWTGQVVSRDLRLNGRLTTLAA